MLNKRNIKKSEIKFPLTFGLLTTLILLYILETLLDGLHYFTIRVFRMCFKERSGYHSIELSLPNACPSCVTLDKGKMVY
jgi:hypothetical protein